MKLAALAGLVGGCGSGIADRLSGLAAEERRVLNPDRGGYSEGSAHCTTARTAAGGTAKKARTAGAQVVVEGAALRRRQTSRCDRAREGASSLLIPGLRCVLRIGGSTLQSGALRKMR